MLVIDHGLDLGGGEASAEVEVVKDLDRHSRGCRIHDDGDLDGTTNGAINVVRVTDTVGEVEGGLGAGVTGAEDLDHVKLTTTTLLGAFVVTLPAAAGGVLGGSGNGSIEQPVGRHVLTSTRLAAVRHAEFDDKDLGGTLESLCTLVRFS